MGINRDDDPDDLDFEQDEPMEDLDLELDEDFWSGENEASYDPFLEGIPVIDPNEEY
jgi:hypothetical protein